MSVCCKIIKDFKRPSASLVQAFAGIPAANVDDCMGRIAAVSSDIRPMSRAQLLGTAFTVRVPEGDNLMFHAALDLAKPGDVIVIDAGGHTERSIFGGIMTRYCKLRGIAGVIVDGSIRDAEEIAELDYPVYAKAVSPNGPYKNGPGEINTPVSFGGKTVYPGDIIIGDADGIVIVRPQEAEVVLKDALAVVKKERKIIEKMETEGNYSRPWVDEKLKEIGCEIINHI